MSSWVWPSSVRLSIVLVYLATLAPSGRRTMASALRRLAFLLAAGRLPDDGEAVSIDPAALPWEQLRYRHAAAIRAALANANAPATANKHLAALRGVLRECWRLGLMNAEDLTRAIDVKSVKGSRLPPGRGLDPGELRALFAARSRDGSPASLRDAAIVAVAYAGGHVDRNSPRSSWPTSRSTTVGWPCACWAKGTRSDVSRSLPQPRRSPPGSRYVATGRARCSARSTRLASCSTGP